MTEHVECDCVPDLGPSHCHPCSEQAGREMPWTEAHPTAESAGVETVTEWGVSWRWNDTLPERKTPQDLCRSREVAKHVAAERRHGQDFVGTVVTRQVTPWKEASDDAR